MLRRWGMFWGVVAIPEGVEVETVFTRMAAWLRRPKVRAAFALAIALEVGAVGSWLYFDHGAHIAEIADQGMSRLSGQHVVYADVCGAEGDNQRIRIVLNDGGAQAGAL